jgi:hypothetical protein
MGWWSRSGWTLAACGVWSGLVLGFAIHGFFHPHAHTVYNIYASAARQWWARENIYARSMEYYRYSPLFAITITPFARLPDPWGNALWKVFCCLVYATGLWAWARRVLPVGLSRNQVAGLFLLALPLSAHSMYIGQANLIMLGCCLLGLGAAAEGRWNRAAGLLALATLIKGYPLALALLLMGLYPRRFALRFAAALSLGLLVPFLTQWPSVVAGQYRNWFDHLRDSTEIMRERLRSLDHLFLLYGQPLAPLQFLILGFLAGGVVLGLSWLLARRTADPRHRLTQVALLYFVWVVLFGPATESCTYVVLGPGIAWAVISSFRQATGWGTRLLLLVSQLLMGPLVTDLFGPWVRNFANEHGSQPVGALLFLVYLLGQVGRRPTETAPAESPGPSAEVKSAA